MPMMKETMLKRLLLPIAAAGGGGSAPVQDTATGNPLVFFTDLARPLKSLLVPFTPIQEGTGDPSPQNVRSILPWNGLSVFGGGKNLFDKTTTVYNVIISSGEIYTTQNGRTVFVPCLPNTTYTVSKIATTRSVIAYATTEGIPVSGDPVYGVKDYRNKTEQSITTGADAKWIVLYLTNTGYDETPVEQVIDSVQLEVGSTATAYEPYHQITETDISFPSPVYGGTLDVVSGVLTVELAFANLNSESAWGSYGTGDGFLVYVTKSDMKVGNRLPGYCDMFPSTFSQTGANIRFGADDNVIRLYNINTLGIADLSEWKEFIGTSGINICYPLATQQTVQLTPSQITAIVGDNTIWSDADGEMTATYLKKAE